MKLAQVVENYVVLKRATGLRYRTAAGILTAFARAVGPIDIRDVDPDTVLAFLNGSGPIRSSWHLKHYTLAGLFRFAQQRRLVSKSPLPVLVPSDPPTPSRTSTPPTSCGGRWMRRACWTSGIRRVTSCQRSRR